ncbi:MAG: FlgD immunoglobulin-like domain containing protein [Polyangiales bacterium]
MAIPVNPANMRGTTAIEGSTLQRGGGTPERKIGDQGLKNDDFMKLLFAQLQNQDPQSPVDTKELVTQLSQLTSVEKLTTMTTKIDELAQATNGMAANQSASLIGKKVEGKNDTAHLDATGGTTTAVNFRQNADKVTVSVLNDAGRVVRTMDLPPQKTGAVNIEWDGMADNLERAKPGRYTIVVDAKDGKGNPIDTDTSVTGVVTGVSYEHGEPELVLGTTRVPLSNVTSIGQ